MYLVVCAGAAVSGQNAMCYETPFAAACCACAESSGGLAIMMCHAQEDAAVCCASAAASRQAHHIDVPSADIRCGVLLRLTVSLDLHLRSLV